MTYKVPEGWEEVKLGEAILVNPRESLDKVNKYKKVSMGDVKEHTKKISGYELERYNGGAKFRNGDTLFARITPCLENGKISYVDILEENEIAFGSTEFLVLREKKNVTLNDYIYYLVKSPEIVDISIKSMVGSSGRQRVQNDVFKNITFNLPPLQEQKAIANTLSAIDDKIELNNKINQNLEAQAQAIFKSWFIDFEPFQDGEFVESELGMIPKGWEIKSLDETADFLNGVAIAKHKPKTKLDETLPAIKIKELRQGFTDDISDRCLTSVDEKYIVNDYDMIFSWSGSLLIDIWVGGKAILNQHLFKVTSEEYNQWYYYYWTKYHLDKFIKIAEDKATTMGHIKRSHLSDAKVLLPDKATYDYMDSVLGNLLDLKIKNNKQNQKLSQLRDTLLPKLISGEIRIPLDK